MAPVFKVPLFIEVLDDVVDERRGLTRFLTAQFNPTEYSLTKASQIAEIAVPGIDSPIQQFVRGQTEALELELFFDSTDTGTSDGAVSVDERVRPFYELVKMQPSTHAPPRVRVIWGEGLSFKAIVASITRKYTLFSSAGLPVRATLSVTFREYKTLEEQLAELKLESNDHTKARVAKRGDNLAALAGSELNDPTAWRVIADENPGVDPLRPEPGETLAIPPTDGGPRVVS